LYRHHHAVVQRTGWTIVRKLDGDFDITAPPDLSALALERTGVSMVRWGRR